ncbi:MbnP family protein [Pontibacter oryzae]|uniref:Copper-binding protein MbnP-like domain-containing protein n=1 Tax=Pontibacter oryzae TaxID=2304593 RepID=A0A399RQW1_9BACT|nr:MbnP family protein [Pontibacter oryzae]RIJ33518.1 hypothetical protein D1627_18060 [Pontibacter oryzae]
MKSLHKIILYAILLPLALFTTSCNDDGTPGVQEPGSITLDVHNQYNSQALQLDNEYNTSSGTKFKFTQLRYIISNVELTAADGSKYKVPESYYVLEKTSAAERSKVELTNIPAGKYTSVTFSVGVDQAVNHSLDLAAGDLKTTSGMAWSWNTGYKFIVAEGQALDPQTDAWESITYHIGTDANYRTVTLALPTAIEVEKRTTSEVMLVAELSKLFNQVNILQYKTVMSGSATAEVATQVADNYASMFTVHHAHSMKME